MKFTYRSKIPSLKNQKFIENFFINKNLKLLVELSKKKKPSVNQMTSDEPYFPELDDLYHLYQYVLINKRTTIFEYGSGWSTLIFSLVLKELRDIRGVMNKAYQLFWGASILLLLILVVDFI